jgi:hypothetical protein
MKTDSHADSSKGDLSMTFSLVSKVQARMALVVLGSIGLMASTGSAVAQSSTSDCRVESVDYKGWHAQQVSNRWIQLVIVPQNGGRLIQVTFAGHAYLFVNPKLAGKYFPPSSSQWFNYGGDKIWLLPEGNEDEQHWVGNSDVLDDGPFDFRKVSEGKVCEIELTGPKDPQTGVQITRTISVEADSPRIAFHATMKNMTGHPLEWSMQSVSQYNTANTSTTGDSGSPMNRDFWTFTPVNPSSSYLNRYHVRFGPAENRTVSVRDDGLFAVHYAHQAAELWLDSTRGWLAVVDGSTRYAMVERFQYDTTRPYPGKASVIFWTNGPEARLGDDGEIALGKDPDASPYYLEAEVNSPMCRLRPGESCSLETEWFPTRAGNEFHGVSDAGILIRPLKATRTQSDKVKLSGTFGVFFSGHLEAHLYEDHGASLATMPVMDVSPSEPVVLEKEVPAPKAGRVSLHLVDESGVDRGALQEVRVENAETR